MATRKMNVRPNTFRNSIIAVSSILPGLVITRPGSWPGNFHGVIQAVSMSLVLRFVLDKEGLHRVSLVSGNVLHIFQPDERTDRHAFQVTQSVRCIDVD